MKLKYYGLNGKVAPANPTNGTGGVTLAKRQNMCHRNS